MEKKIRTIGAAVLVAVWVLLVGFMWFGVREDTSVSERRPLAQMPEISGKTLLGGDFMEDFEEFTLDQFPLRDTFRRIKSLFHYYVLGQKDNNDIYITEGYAAKLEYPLNQSSIDYALKRFQSVYDMYLASTDSKVYFTVVPDKGYYLGAENGYPVMDYASMFTQLADGLPWAEFVDLTDCLSAKDYYYTDTHWRQERLLTAAGKLSQAMGVTAPKAEDYTVTEIQRPFYGVYYGQAALPLDSEPLYVMKSDLLDACTVFSYEDNSTTDVYNMNMLDSRDLYDVFLSGSRSLLRIDNPNAKTDRELVVFRDSFGSSMVPLLVQDYKTVTLVDIRYLNSKLVGNYVTFDGQDILFLYSTLVLNNSTTLK